MTETELLDGLDKILNGEPAWIPAKGDGICPVPAGTRTEVKFRNGETYVDSVPEQYGWYDGGADHAIVAYRRVSPLVK